MKIKTREQISTGEIVERHGVTKELLIGKYDDSNEIVLRLVSIDVNRYIPPHTQFSAYLEN